MRLVEPWFGSGKVVVADSWFGSIKYAEELAEKGMHACLSVKGNTKGFPKTKLFEKVTQRGEAFCLKQDVALGLEGEGPTTTLYAAAHMDKKPMHLISTCSMLIAGPQRVRHRYHYNEVLGTMEHK